MSELSSIQHRLDQLKRLWSDMVDIGTTDDMTLWEQKRTRLVNGISFFCIGMYTIFIIAYLGQEGLITTKESAVALVFFITCILLNHWRYYTAAIVTFNLSAVIIFMYYSIAHGEIDGAEYLLYATSVATMIFFRRLWPIIILFTINFIAFWLCKYSFTAIEPLVVLPEGSHLYIENHVVTFAGLFFIVYYFRSENRRQEQKLQAQNESLEELDKAKSNFFANISHEFRTPLTLIISPMDELKEMVTGERGANLVKVMERNAHMLLNNVNELLDLSKLNAGKLRLDLETWDIVNHLKVLIQSYDSYTDQKGIRLHFSSPYQSLDIVCDIRKIEHIVQNLMSNAFKFTPEGGLVECNIYPSATSTEYIEISVSDTGIGIPDEHLEQIFERFYQVDDSMTKNYKGTGIGLALVKELVELHGGQIRAENNLKQGTKFTFSLPIQTKKEIDENDDQLLDKGKSKVEKIARKERSTHSTRKKDPVSLIQGAAPLVSDVSSDAGVSSDAKGSDVLGSDALVLVVEDNEDVRDYIVYYLKDHFQIIEAEDGREGIEKAQHAIPDLIISDVMMPYVDGYQLCDTLKQDVKTAHIPIIMLTARTSIKDKLEGFSFGADDYLVKPFDTRELHARIDNLINNRKRLQSTLQNSNYAVAPELDLTPVDQQFLGDMQTVLADHYANQDFGTTALSAKLLISERQLRRKIKGLTGLSPNMLIRNYRLDIAKELIENKTGGVNDIAYQIGFSSPSYFSKCYKEKYGVSPSEVI